MISAANASEREDFIRFISLMCMGRGAGGRMMEKDTHGGIAIMGMLFLKGARTPSQLAAHMHVTPGRISTAISRLQAKGLVKTVNDTADRRRVLIELTDEGQMAVRQHFEEITGRFLWVFNQMGAHRSRQFVELMSDFFTYLSVAVTNNNEPPTSEQVDEAFRERDERLERNIPVVRRAVAAVFGDEIDTSAAENIWVASNSGVFDSETDMRTATV